VGEEIPPEMVEELGADLAARFLALDGALRGGEPFDEAAFWAAAFAYFDRCLVGGTNPDPFFNWIGSLALPRPGTPLALTGLWEWALAIVHTWEDAAPGRRVHKGTGYYFAGMRDIALGNLDRGFLYMHQAAVEDRISTGDPMPPRPAIWFITLDPRDPGQAYHEKVKEYEAYLAAQLAAYRDSGRGGLTIGSLRERLVRHDALLDSITAIAHIVARASSLGSPKTRRIRSSDFAGLVLSQLGLELCLVLEELMLRPDGSPGGTFKPLAAWYAPQAGMPLTEAELGQLNGRFKAAFEQTLIEVLDGRQVASFSRSLSDRESDLVAAYGIRNRSAHGLERPAAVSTEFDRLMPRLYFASLLSLVVGYPKRRLSSSRRKATWHSVRAKLRHCGRLLRGRRPPCPRRQVAGSEQDPHPDGL
jgi:hypothetical protein